MYTFVRACFAIVMRRTMDQFATKSPKLQLVKGELFPIERFVGEDVPENNLHEVNGVTDLVYWCIDCNRITLISNNE